ncbi:hypothetical protein D9613_010476 [Agrocybe pediades]|uniref:Carbohydrate esterase family 16 protein n=1 Tax=Agrocybe pediades TaxID=84607 RepID=A0A8H4QG11_9AGAR|nr:hypothetical protein D9613_010476 [Agrocybe pediades]
MSKVHQVTSSWKGFSSLEQLVIFGDSYSDVWFRGAHSPRPTSSQPLGIEFPGATYNEPNLPNWVGYLITHPRFGTLSEEQGSYSVESQLLVYDFAIGGGTVSSVRYQYDRLFLPMVESDPELFSPDTVNTLFVTWVGINDCALKADRTNAHNVLFSVQEELYRTGARNFLFIDVPPIHRSPAVPQHAEGKFASVYTGWNSSLNSRIEQFCRDYADASVFLFSAYQLFDDFLTSPDDYNLDPRDVKRPGGSIWIDRLHPTSKVHEIIASKLGSFLEQVK